MNEPDITLTNLALVVLCVACAVDLRRRGPAWSAALYAASACAALAGAIFHGFVRSEVMWRVVLLSLGGAGLGLAHLALWIRRAQPPSRLARIALWAALGAYAVVAVFITGHFSLALVGYLVPTLWLAVQAWRRGPSPATRLIIGGIVVSLVAMVIQVARIGVHPTYFTADALYHVVTGVGLLSLWAGLVRLPR
jgi:hypothetical protein